MPRSTYGPPRRQKKNRWLKKTKGNRGSRRNQWRKTKQTVIRSGVYAYRDRRLVKRDYRQLWILRINAACRMRGMNYSRFIAGLKACAIDLNRKMLSEIALTDPDTFDTLVEQAKAAVAEHEKKVAQAA